MLLMRIRSAKRTISTRGKARIETKKKDLLQGQGTLHSSFETNECWVGGVGFCLLIKKRVG